MAPRDPVAWGRQLARALAAIHLTPVTGTDVGFLPCQEARLDALLASGSSGRRVAEHPDGELVWAALQLWRTRLPGASPTLVHGDYWVGNTLWEGRRLTGVVDWSDAYLGDPAADVGYCRTGLASVGGPEAPRAFLGEYEAVTGGPVRHLVFWDLLGAWRALPDPGDWVAGLHDLGRRDITRGQMRAELRDFIAEALALAV
jgi:aminoglycoside phosphotransferase (APT) family kinase protein